MGIVTVLSGLTAGLILLGMLYEWSSARRDKQKYAPPGELVNVGEHRLHIHCLGKDQDGPVVVFESGSGSSGIDWTLVQQEVAYFAPACAYDRAGYGWSESVANPRTLEVTADELHTLLVNAGINGPYILVGHAFGGFIVRMFAARFPDDVTGIVLVDSSHPKTFAPASYNFKGELKRLQRVAIARRLGLIRLFGKKIFWHMRAFPDALHSAYIAINMRNSTAVRGEVQPLAEKGVQLPDSLGDLPLTIVSRSIVTKYDDTISSTSQEWQEQQQELAALSSNSIHIIAEKGGRFVHIDQPGIVVDAIEQMVEAIRQAN
jgi:pimeloyl-ACP methyl ester carboxylesterase